MVYSHEATSTPTNLLQHNRHTRCTLPTNHTPGTAPAHAWHRGPKLPGLSGEDRGATAGRPCNLRLSVS